MHRLAAVFAVFLVFIPALLQADEGIKLGTDLGLQLSSRPEAKIGLTQSFTFPFLQGSSPLTLGNNIKTAVTAEATPISLAGITQVIWTPIAFLELVGGGKLGSGWNIPLGKGLGLNVPVGVYNPEAPREAEVIGRAFDGFIWNAWGGGAFQFDMAAIIPGDWNHVIFRAYNELRYSAYTRAGPSDSWFFENGDGENRNGWTWHGNMVLGYQMPLSPVLDFVGLMAEMHFNLYNTPGREFWGDNLGLWIFSSFFNFSFTPRFSTTLVIQMRTRRNHGITDFENRDQLWYQDLELLNDGGPQRLVFYRTALILSYKIK